MSQTILIIDDDKIVVKSVEKLLKKANYRVHTASSGREAIEKVSNNDFDLIISDVRMPDINGIETVKRIRALLKDLGKAPIPEIFMTGYACQENAEKAKNLKVADYIYKPFDIQEFLTSIQLNLPKKGA